MSQTHDTALPSHEVFCQIVNGDDLLSVIIRGHQFCDAALTRLLSEALLAPDSVEITRLSFGLKVDLCVALHLLRSDSRPLYMGLNRIRNRFAHDPNAAYDQKDTVDLWNAFSAHQRQVLGRQSGGMPVPRVVLSEAIAITFLEAKSSGNQLRDQKLHDEVLHEMVLDVLGDRAGVVDEYTRHTDKEIARRVELKKAARAGQTEFT